MVLQNLILLALSVDFEKRNQQRVRSTYIQGIDKNKK